MRAKILEVQSLYKTYGTQESRTDALNGIDFQVFEGEFLGIMGASGSGKSTVLNCIAAVLRPSKGKILFEGKDLSEFKEKDLAGYRGNRMGYLFQEFELLDNLTGQENILLPAAIHGLEKSKQKERLRELAEHFGIREILHKFPTQMSGGQKQRVAAARAMILEPDILLADEPSGALDSGNSEILMGQLEGMNRERNTSILMVTHDPGAASYCSRILFLQDGKVFHELRKRVPSETRQEFYERILDAMTQLRGGRAHVF